MRVAAQDARQLATATLRKFCTATGVLERLSADASESVNRVAIRALLLLPDAVGDRAVSFARFVARHASKELRFDATAALVMVSGCRIFAFADGSYHGRMALCS